MEELVLALKGLSLIMEFDADVKNVLELASEGDRKGAEVALGEFLGKFYLEAVKHGADLAAERLGERLRAIGLL